MANISIPSWLQKPLRYIVSYLLFALFGLLGFLVMVRLQSVIVSTGILINDGYGVAGFLNVWGFFFLLGIYFICIVIMESSMNKAARSGEILRPGLRIFAIEGGLLLLTILVPLISNALIGVR